jgi:hypothetical protein
MAKTLDNWLAHPDPERAADLAAALAQEFNA